MRFSTPISVRAVWPCLLLVGAAVAEPTLAKVSAAPPSLDESEHQPVLYTGHIQPDKRLHDGGLRHVVGVHHRQVFRANRSSPTEEGRIGWTYNHQPFMAHGNNRFYVQYLSDLVEEHTPPGRTLLVSSEDGRRWSRPVVAFPVYEIPEVQHGAVRIPKGTTSVMHQRMGFYVAPNGRLLTLAFYSHCATPRHSPNRGHGIGRVVRQVLPDGTLGPIYFIRINRHAGWNEENTRYPFYTESDDGALVEACDAMLADPLATLQWWEEDRGTDGFFAIDPSDVAQRDPAESLGEVTTSAGAGKALCYYHRPDGVVVGLWKNQWGALSPDEGATWTGRVRCGSLMTCGAKVWGQKTEDGRFALVYNHSATRRNRFPLVVMTGDDGHRYDNMLLLQGEVPPKRYQGIHKNPGPQYVRGIMEGNGNPAGNAMWNTYSMNKEDIWVARTRVPVSGTVRDAVRQDFESVETEADLEFWNLYIPRWAPVHVVREEGVENRCLEMRDEEPFDYARVERAFPEGRNVRVGFRVLPAEVPLGHALEVEVQDRRGRRPMRLRIDNQWLGLDRDKVFPLEPIPIETGRWYDIEMRLDCDAQTYDLAVNGETSRKNIPFAEEVETLERLVLRTGPYRGDVRLTVMETGEPRPAGLTSEDLPGADRKAAPTLFLIDDVWTAGS